MQNKKKCGQCSAYLGDATGRCTVYPPTRINDFRSAYPVVTKHNPACLQFVDKPVDSCPDHPNRKNSGKNKPRVKCKKCLDIWHTNQGI